MGDQAAFLKLLLKHQTDIKAFIGSLVRDAHLREDIFQDVVLIAWEQFDKYDPTRSFGAWARGVAANKILQRRHQDRRFPVTFSNETIQAVLEAFNRTEKEASRRAEALQECLKAVPERSRQLLAMRYGQGLSGHEISRRAGTSLDAVYQALLRVRAAIEKCIRRRLGAGGTEA